MSSPFILAALATLLLGAAQAAKEQQSQERPGVERNKWCIDSSADFEAKLLDGTTSVLRLCNGFQHFPTKSVDLSGKMKTITCIGTCTIDGSKFEAEESSAFTADGTGFLHFERINFENFKTVSPLRLPWLIRRSSPVATLTAVSPSHTWCYSLFLISARQTSPRLLFQWR